jgi:glycosyltransferase involved in cell wall biosynthesis
MLLPRLNVLHQHPPRPLRARRLPDLRTGSEPPPAISIVTPSFQQGRFLRHTLGSVVEQAYPRLEYFVQDGGSTDESAAILREFDGQLSGWESAADRGQAHAINVAFERTSGEIMAWLNSDDLLLPGALRYVAQFFARNPEVSVVYGNRILIDDQGLEVGCWVLPNHQAEVLPWADYIPQETLFWRRSAWEKVGGRLDESLHFAIDWDLLLRFQTAGVRFAHLPHFLGAFRLHAEQKTSAHMDTLGKREMADLRRKYLGYVPSELEIHTQVAGFLYRHLLAHARVYIRDEARF